MDDPRAVGVLQRVGRFPRDPERVLQRQLALPVQPTPERLPVDERHREPEEVRRAVLRSHGAAVEDREDVGVLEAGGEADLALEAIGAEGGGDLGVEDLERDRAVVPQVLREIDRGHAPAPELPLERVSLPQRFTKCRDRIRHPPRFFGGTAKDTSRAHDVEGVGRWQ